MRISELRRYFCFFCLFSFILLAGGCSDSPDKQAVKELHSRLDKALELASKEGELDKARDEIRKALKSARRIGEAADPAVLTGANFTYALGQDLLLDIESYVSGVDSLIERMQTAIAEMNRLEIQQGQVEGILSGMEQEVVELQRFINEGQDGQASLKERLAKANAQLANLESQKANFEDEMKRAQESAAKIEEQAQETTRAVFGR